MSNEQALQIVEYHSQRVLTTAQIARAYSTDEHRITDNFSRNKERFISGKHYICLEGEALKAFKKQIATTSENAMSSKNRLNKLYLWTEKGAFLHAKSLNTDRAWEVYDHLVDEYYRLKDQTLATPEQRIPFNWLLHERLKLFVSQTRLLPGYWCIFKEVASYTYLYPRLIDAALPDGSVGSRWMKYVRQHSETFDLRLIQPYDHRYPDKRGVVQANQYPNTWLAAFRIWFEETYLKEHLQQYLKPRIPDQLALPEAKK